jgi:hypothetical protein
LIAVILYEVELKRLAAIGSLRSLISEPIEAPAAELVYEWVDEKDLLHDKPVWGGRELLLSVRRWEQGKPGGRRSGAFDFAESAGKWVVGGQ